ncbi:DUF4400 domain-containing protein [Pluralibacter gergoviae]|uniref:DUF4400 domain-containing protein n=1 Tax=Pluralibacter gergoviae TaxID=61647 RepID=UPI002881977A|nr:DUF4400 domain-containing protein [Pluralibacter gergoviae]ELK5593194.1 DUF4400 domain-containing protein [Pluralibacter gergoviae]
MRSLLLSDSSVFVFRWVMMMYQWLFVDRGFLDWIQRAYAWQVHSQNAVVSELN